MKREAKRGGEEKARESDRRTAIPEGACVACCSGGFLLRDLV